MTTNLYEKDFFQWIEKQAIALKHRQPELLDWENLLEEVEYLGKEQINAVNSFLKQIIVHRLKLEYTNETDSYNHWMGEIDNFQDEIEDKLTKTLQNKIDLQKAYERAKRIVQRKYPVDLPSSCPYTFEELMTRFPTDNNH
jgi:hypothetical protein